MKKKAALSKEVCKRCMRTQLTLMFTTCKVNGTPEPWRSSGAASDDLNWGRGEVHCPALVDPVSIYSLPEHCPFKLEHAVALGMSHER
jgi:hypothetical protein